LGQGFYVQNFSSVRDVGKRELSVKLAAVVLPIVDVRAEVVSLATKKQRVFAQIVERAKSVAVYVAGELGGKMLFGNRVW
jgi:hypothetical protein